MRRPVLAKAGMVAVALALAWVSWRAVREEPLPPHAPAPVSARGAEPSGIAGNVDEAEPAAEPLAVNGRAPAPRVVATDGPIGRSPDLLVRLVNGGGRAVDHHPVRVLAASGSEGGGGGRHLYEETDERGFARFARAELERLAPEEDFPLRAELGTRHPDPPFAQLLLSEVTGEPLELRADLGRLVVRAREPDGTAWTGTLGALVEPRGYHHHSSAGPSPRILWVPVGVPYVVAVYRCGLYREVEQDCPPLPPSAPEREHVLQLDRSHPGLRGVALDEAGARLPEGTGLDFRDHGRDGQGGRLAIVRSAGAFELALDQGESEGETRTFAITTERDGVEDAAGVDVTFEVPGEGSFVDVGEIVLADRPLLAAGRVVPPEGLPADGICVEAQVPAEPETGEALDDSEDRWTRHPDLDNCVYTDEVGAFAVFASDVGGPYRLRIEAGGGVAAMAVREGIAFGTTDLVVSLAPTGTLTVRVDDGDERLPSDYRVALLHDADDPAGDRLVTRWRWLRKDGGYTFSDLLPGTARLELWSGTGEVLGERAGLRIAGGRTTDAGTLGLDPTLSWLRISLPAGRWSVRLLYGPAGSGTFDRQWELSSRAPWVPVRSLPVDIVARAPGYREELLRDVSGDIDLDLREGPRVDLRVVADSELVSALAAEDLELVARLEPVAAGAEGAVGSVGERNVAKAARLRPGDGGGLTTHLALDEPGRYAVWLQVRDAAPEPERESPWSAAGELEIGAAGGSFEVRAPDVELPD